MDEDPWIYIILGRPFLATTGVVIDVKNHILSLAIGDFLSYPKQSFEVVSNCTRNRWVKKVELTDTLVSLISIHPTYIPSSWEANQAYFSHFSCFLSVPLIFYFILYRNNRNYDLTVDFTMVMGFN